MPLLHVYWEKTLFGVLYQTPKAGLFQTTLQRWQPQQVQQSLVYGELFYAAAPEQLGSFTYSYNPLSQTVRSHIALWTGHQEQLEYSLDARRQLAYFRYTLQHGGTAVSWACIAPRVKEALAQKCDDHILLAKVSPTE